MATPPLLPTTWSTETPIPLCFLWSNKETKPDTRTVVDCVCLCVRPATSPLFHFTKKKNKTHQLTAVLFFWLLTGVGWLQADYSRLGEPVLDSQGEFLPEAPVDIYCTSPQTFDVTRLLNMDCWSLLHNCEHLGWLGWASIERASENYLLKLWNVPHNLGKTPPAHQQLYNTEGNISPHHSCCKNRQPVRPASMLVVATMLTPGITLLSWCISNYWYLLIYLFIFGDFWRFCSHERAWRMYQEECQDFVPSTPEYSQTGPELLEATFWEHSCSDCIQNS